MSAHTQELFGGAITAVLPSRLIDASTIRQVPDTQEVFIDPNTGLSVILEVLQRVDVKDNTDSAKFHFDSIAHDNGAQVQHVNEVQILPNQRGDDTPHATILYGTQDVTKFNNVVPDRIRILLAVYRVESKNADLVLSMNVPMETQDGLAVTEDGWQAARKEFNTAAQSLRICDFALFA